MSDNAKFMNFYPRMSLPENLLERIENPKTVIAHNYTGISKMKKIRWRQIWRLINGSARRGDNIEKIYLKTLVKTIAMVDLNFIASYEWDTIAK